MSALAKPRPMTAARKGHIVQRVIVDGWTSAEAAAAFGIKKRRIDAWVSDYRRHGMASLHPATERRIAAKMFRGRVLRPVSAGLRRLFARKVAAASAPLPHLPDEGRHRP